MSLSSEEVSREALNDLSDYGAPFGLKIISAESIPRSA
jgi:hypothetical protein